MMPQIYIIKIFRKMKKKKKMEIYIQSLACIILSNSEQQPPPWIVSFQIRSQNLTTGWIDICKRQQRDKIFILLERNIPCLRTKNKKKNSLFTDQFNLEFTKKCNSHQKKKL